MDDATTHPAEELISLFIDNEMSLDHKIDFVEYVHVDLDYKDLTLDLLRQEKLLRADEVETVPAAVAPQQKRRWRVLPLRLIFKPLIPALAAALLLFFLWQPDAPIPDQRFVIYQPKAQNVEITGTFTGWQPVPMNRVGNSGYWEQVLAVPPGEHRFSYILDGREQLPDPTILTREQDDFGGVNSILMVEASV